MRENPKARIGNKGKGIILVEKAGEYFMQPKEGWELERRLIEVFDYADRYFGDCDTYIPLKEFLKFTKENGWEIAKCEGFLEIVEKIRDEGFTPRFRPMFVKLENGEFVKIPNFVAIFRERVEEVTKA